jgi:hypothetical protein
MQQQLQLAERKSRLVDTSDVGTAHHPQPHASLSAHL